jgi:mono/diheme cytochrome c family protein
MRNRILQRFIIPAAVLVAFGAATAFNGQSDSPLQRLRGFSKTKTNPYAGQAEAQRAGAKLFRRHCAACHGPDGQGIGKAPPLISNRARNAAPGAWYGVLRNGSLASGMPSFSRLPEAQRWQIVTWLQHVNEGDAQVAPAGPEALQSSP